MVVRFLLLGGFCAVISAVMILASAKDSNTGAAWVWAAIFAVSSLVAAYSFWRLLSDGGAT